MNSIRRLSFPLLLCGLLLAALVGVVSARPGAAPMAVTSKTVTVSASDCYPWSDDADYLNEGYRVRSVTGAVSFLCPVRFPEYGTHTISQITMRAYDNNNGDNVCAQASRTQPSSGNETIMGEVCSSGYKSTNPRSFTISGAQINPNTVEPTHGMYFWATTEDPSKLRLYGFTITYDVATP
jgi:hypothetical protein